MNLSTKQAMGILEKALAKAEEIGVFVNIAVLDTGGHMKGFVRMDRAFIACIDIAKGKNFYALRLPSHRIGKFLKPESKMYGISSTNGGLLGFKGGIPVSLKGETIAYIGVSGGTPEQDLEIAIAGSTFV